MWAVAGACRNNLVWRKEKAMRVTKIQQLVDVLVYAFEHLQVTVSLRELEEMAVTIHKIMTTHARSFHTLEHVFDLSDVSNPIRSLAALFHDLVYYQVDRSIPPDVHAEVSPYIRQDDSQVYLRGDLDPADQVAALTLQVFGFEVGQNLSPYAGLNEFLSALFMGKRLAQILPRHTLLGVTVCIEATIPFRGPDGRGRSHFKVLEERLITINQNHQLSMTDHEIEEMVKEAVLFANDDVANFAVLDPGVFLDNTWKLLPETNAALRAGDIYSIHDYRVALQKMGGFLNSLNPEHVFHAFRGVPPEDEFQRMTDLARQNISTARDYLDVKLVAIAILEALSEITGGDAPLSLFMGDIPREGETVKRLEDFLPSVPAPRPEDQTALYWLLEAGRASESVFDLKNSPTSLFLYQSLGLEEVQRVLTEAQGMFDGTLAPRDFLEQVDDSLVAAIAEASASMVVTRCEGLLRYARSREPGTRPSI
jgi:hypothetical protein